MASRRFFGYDPYDFYYPASYHYPDPYYHQQQLNPYYHHHNQPAPARSAAGFFPVAGDADQYYGYRREPSTARRSDGFFPAAGDVDPYYQPAPSRRAGDFFPPAAHVQAPAAREAAGPKAGASRSVHVPVRFVGTDPEPEIARVPVKRAQSAEDAAVRLQAAARGFLARRAVRALRAVEREAEEAAGKVAREAEALRGDARARVAVGEELMRLLLRLDAVRGAREYRRRVARRVLAVQDAVDALEPDPASEVTEAAAGEMAEGSDVAPELPVASGTERTGEAEPEAVHEDEADAEMDVDGDTAAGEPCAADETERAPDVANPGDDMADNADEDGEWEMVTEVPEPAGQTCQDSAGEVGETEAAVDVLVAAAAAPQSPQQQEPAREEVTSRPAAAGGADGGVDAKKVMEMMAALCERSAQQCAVIGALAERVDALERAVRRVEDAERRRRRAKKLRKEGKGSNSDKCNIE